MLNSPFAPWPSFSDVEAEAVRALLLSNRVNYWTGEQGREFEREFAAWADCAHAVAVANGTNALELALEGLQIGDGDEVITTPRTYLATASAIVRSGAAPVFADVDRATQNITAESIARVISPRTRAIIAVHLAGQPCDMDPIMELAQAHGLKVIEDCAQAHGARYKGRSVGSIGDAGAWSFCQDKIMTTGGEGGMLTTNSKSLWNRVWSAKDHGKSYAAVYEREHPPGFRWLHESFGSNYRMTEMQAAIGRIQLKRMAQWTRQRIAHADQIRAAAQRCEVLRVPLSGCGPACGEAGCGRCMHAYYKCYVFVRPERLAPGWSRDRIMNEVSQAGVPCFSGSCSEVYLEKAFDGTPWRPQQRLPVARELGETSLMFLVHPTLKPVEIEKTCQVLAEVCARALAS